MPSENERQKMKKIIAVAMLLAIATANVQTAHAGNREWATVGKVLTGVAAGVVIANALDCHPAHYSVTYSSYAPAPSIVRHHRQLFTRRPASRMRRRWSMCLRPRRWLFIKRPRIMSHRNLTPV